LQLCNSKNIKTIQIRGPLIKDFKKKQGSWLLTKSNNHSTIVVTSLAGSSFGWSTGIASSKI
jgi:hypothetical protein